MIRRLRIALVLPLMGLVLPAAAQANVYCVPNLGIKPACQGATQEATVQDGLDAAKAHAGADTVLVGQGSFTGGVYSESADPLNTIDLIGAGTGQTKILVPSQPGSDQGIGLTAPAGSTVSGLTVSIPDDGDTESDRGIFLDFEARADDVAVEADSAADNVDGVVMSGSAALDNSSVHLPADAPSGSIAVHQSSGSPTIADSTLRAATGVTHTGTGFTTRVERSTIEAKLGLSTDVGGMVIRDSVIDLGSHDGAVGLRAANFNDGVSQMVIVATNVTVVGGGADSVGARAEADSEQLDDPVGDDDSQVTEAELDDTVDDGETATVVLNSSIISGPEVSISARADRGESATVTTSYSNYDAKATEDVDDISGKNAQGVATLTQSSQNNLSPDFVAPGAANYHLRPTSALRDIGDPAAPPNGTTDLDGNPRVLDGDNNCASQRDIGADELVAAPPTASIASGPAEGSTTTDPTPTFSFASSRDCEPVFRCSLDDGAFVSCPSPTTLGLLSNGSHNLSVTALGELNDQGAPVGRSFSVDATAPQTTITSGPPAKLKTKRKRVAVSFAFSSNDPGATFDCALDSGAFIECASPARYKLELGKHTFKVRATDPFAHVDPTPATWNVTVKHIRKLRKRK